MEAIEDVLALPDEAWERRMALPWLVRLGMLEPQRGATKEAIMTEVREWFERYTKGLVQKGRQEALGNLFGKRLGRPLTARERASLRRRLSQLGEERVADVLLNTSPRELTAWLADPAAS